MGIEMYYCIFPNVNFLQKKYISHLHIYRANLQVTGMIWKGSGTILTHHSPARASKS